MAAALVSASVLSCQKDVYTPGNISVEFQFESLPIDLNIVDNPFVTCVVRSETGLKQIEMYIESEDGTLAQYKDVVTEFFNPIHHSIYERPVYKEGMTAFVVKAYDLGGNVVEGRVVFEMTSKVKAPVITFSSDELSFAEGDPIPQFGFTVSADADLESVTVELIQSAESSELVEPVIDFTDAKNFEFDSSVYDLTQYDLNRIPQLIRVVAVDNYGKTSISTLTIKYKALPVPVVTSQSSAEAVEFEDFSVVGKTSSETGISKVECYAVGKDYEVLASSVDVDELKEYDIAMTVPGKEIRDYLTAIKVIVTDARNKKAETVINLIVTPVFEAISSSANLVDEINKRFNDAKYRNVKLLLPSGASYNLSSAIKLTKNLMLKSDDKEVLPVVNVTSTYTFDTDNAALDVVSFENISFKTTKSATYFMGNQSSAASIGEISVKGCVFEGYVNSFYRTGARADISSLIIDDTRFWWANTNSNYSFLHFTQTSGSLAFIKITNTTFTGVLYLHYNNLKDTNCVMEVSNCTFANSKASNNCYFIAYANSSVKGQVILKKNLFGGTNNLTGNCRMLRANAVTKDLSDNYCTKSWKTFVDDATNSSVNFCNILPDSEDNDTLFKDSKNLDFTINTGTTVFNYQIGDIRWIK